MCILALSVHFHIDLILWIVIEQHFSSEVLPAHCVFTCGIHLYWNCGFGPVFRMRINRSGMFAAQYLNRFRRVTIQNLNSLLRLLFLGLSLIVADYVWGVLADTSRSTLSAFAWFELNSRCNLRWGFCVDLSVGLFALLSINGLCVIYDELFKQALVVVEE